MTAPQDLHPAAAGRFVPRGVATGVGSLPFERPSEAVAFVEAHCAELPFCPQPPTGDDLEAAVTRQVREFGLPGGRERRWFNAFHRAVTTGRFPRARAFKTQVTGPVTQSQFCTRNGVPAHRDPLALAALTASVSAMAVWEIRRLRPAGRPVIVAVDEPALGALPVEDRLAGIGLLAPVFAAIRTSGGIPALHCCAGVEPEILARADIDIVSFDAGRAVWASAGDRELLEDPNRSIAFGLVPTDGEGVDPLTSWLASATEVRDPIALARRTLVTPTCGLGAVDAASAERVFRVTAAASRTIGRIAAQQALLVPLAGSRPGAPAVGGMSR